MPKLHSEAQIFEPEGRIQAKTQADGLAIARHLCMACLLVGFALLRLLPLRRISTTAATY